MDIKTELKMRGLVRTWMLTPTKEHMLRTLVKDAFKAGRDAGMEEERSRSYNSRMGHDMGQ